ncbi:MAG: DUF402 domain-containing protein [Firmicutes bacterium]|nr:DUF402 domain-containing protein [Bacillota bacterium]
MYMLEELKIGDIYEVHCYKHNGKIDRVCDEAMILDVTEDYIVCGNYKSTLTESNGKSHKTKEAAILFFYKKRWFNILAQLKKYGLFYYCNIASPFLIDEKIIKYIDYDLDLRIFPDGSFKVLDKNEYKYHKKIMKYPKEIDDILNFELSNLIEQSRNKEFPFNKDIVDKYYEKYLELRKEKENQKND